jgi:mRNA interferase RelE/StbE
VPYTIAFTPQAAKALRELERGIQKRIGEKIDQLARNPRPHGVEKLSGMGGAHRVRVGDFRIIYQVGG